MHKYVINTASQSCFSSTSYILLENEDYAGPFPVGFKMSRGYRLLRIGGHLVLAQITSMSCHIFFSAVTGIDSLPRFEVLASFSKKKNKQTNTNKKHAM